MKERNTILHSRSAFAIAVFAFVFLVGGGKPIDFVMNFKLTEIHSLVIVAPCIIFGLTVDAYYYYITRYRGAVAGLSLIFLLFALLCCFGLVLNKDWWMHLRYIYLLFLSYVFWDVLMIEILLTSETFPVETHSQLKRDIHETKLVSFFINMPTMITIFFVSVFCAYCVAKGKVPEESVKTFVAGVVSFHLIFSSAAYLSVRWQSHDS